jgi:5-methylcytosine-specific restriction enzyme subunit McrC
MSSNKPIVVFEHSRLFINDEGFEKRHFDALAKFNDLHKSKYFEIGHQKITFKSYVGVIQAGSRVIEILPKADNLDEESDGTKNKWQHALLYMLKTAGYIKLNQTNQLDQHTSSENLMDIYLHAFLKEVEQLIHAGLVKKYKRIRANQTAFKGRLLIEKQLQHNVIHKERFYTEHTTYNRDNLLNRILKTALKIIRETSFNSRIKTEAAKSLLYFEDILPWQGNESDFKKIKLDRKALPYKYALELAKMIILNYCPDMKSGKQHVLALLFDMNRLFEKFVFRMIKRLEEQFKEYDLLVTAQNSRTVWGHKTIRPDIVLTFKKANNNRLFKTIIDTKWKIADEGLRWLELHGHEILLG